MMSTFFVNTIFRTPFKKTLTVTLFKAHKVVLSACSPFFKSILKRNPHQHPLLYLKGVNSQDLGSLLNFMYQGQVNVAQVGVVGQNTRIYIKEANFNED